MNKRFYVFGVLALVLAVGGTSAAFARADEAGSGGQAGAGVGVTATVSGEDQGDTSVTASSTVRVESRTETQTETQAQNRVENRGEATSSESEQGDQASTTGREHAVEASEAPEHAAEAAFEHSHSFLFDDAASTTARSAEELKQAIEKRQHDIEDQIASSTPEDRPVLENASSTAVAVHALLAARTILGGIGEQVSEIAQEMNHSLATTTSAEAEIQSRGFWTRLFFGGDTQAADRIQQAVQVTQQNVARLTDLLNQASTTAEVKATLEVQIQAIEAAQTRLQELADQQKGLWGIFSWRFGS